MTTVRVEEVSDTVRKAWDPKKTPALMSRTLRSGINFYERFAEYSKETHRSTVHQTFEPLINLVSKQDEEEQRVVREDLDEEHIAVFALVVQFKHDLPKRARSRAKDVCRLAPKAIKAKRTRLDDWRSKEQTGAQVKTLIHDFRYDEERGLPEEAEPEEIENLADVVFLHVYTQHGSAQNSAYQETA